MDLARVLRPVGLHLESQVLDGIARQAKPCHDERGGAAKLVDQVIDVARDPFPLQVDPAEVPVFRGVLTEVKLAGPRIIKLCVSLLLIFEKTFQLVPQRCDLGLVLQSRIQQRSDRFRGRGGKVGIVDEDHHDHPLVEDVHDLLLDRVVAERSQGAVEMLRAVLRRAHDVGFQVIAARDDPPLGLKCLPDGLGLVLTESSLKLVLLDIHRQGAQPPAGGQIQKVPQHVTGAEGGVALILAQALDQVSQIGNRLLA